MLKRLLLVVIVVVIVTGTGFAEPLPRVETEQPVFEFGEVMRGQKVKHTFIFRNSGDAMLVVDRVKSTCGCTGVLLSEKNIPPGGTGTIKATFNSSRFKGKVEKRILLYSNDPIGRPVSFIVKGTVILPIKTDPAQISFGEVAVGQKRTATATLTNNSGAPIKLVGLQPTNRAFRAEVELDVLDGDETTQLRVITEPDAKTTHLNGAVLIRIEPSSLGEIRIPVSGRLVKGAPVVK